MTGSRPGEQHDCPGPQYTDIIFTRHQGRGITVDTAPTHTRIHLTALLDRYAYLHMPAPDRIVFADQVVYRVTSYEDGALTLELEHDWRPKTEETTVPTCTATIEGPNTPGGRRIQCTRAVGHPESEWPEENHVGRRPGGGHVLWTDHTAGATPHRPSSEEQPPQLPLPPG